jgi:photosystem II stability/assembly factor-like uncharacterized protein
MIACLAIVLTGCAPLSPLQPNISQGGRAVSVTHHPSNNNELFVASESGGIFKSTNGGVNWTQVSSSTNFWFTDVKYCVANPSIIIATASNDTKVANGGGIWRSTDGGSHWAQITLSPSVASCGATLSAYCIANEPGNNKIWVGTTCGLAVSNDNGVTFSFISSSSNYNNDAVYAVLTPQANQLKILTDAGLKVSSDDGANWTYSNTGLPGYVAKGEHAQIACSPLNHQNIFWAFNSWVSGWHTGIYMSTDNGASWSVLIDNPGINRRPTCMTALSLSGVANKFDVYFSDGGCTFKRATFTNGTPPAISGSWTSLNTNHCDYSDLCFKTDGKTPFILTGDGGLLTTVDNGANWTLSGAGTKGYNALQITEVTGQLHSGDGLSDLYFGTQDNNIWASPDAGVSWTNSICCEGFFLNIPRAYYPPTVTKLSGVTCGACYNFISGPLLSGAGGFPNPPNSTGNPCLLLSPGNYIESDTLPGAPTVNIFSLTTNTGSTWAPKYAFTEPVRDLSKVAGSGSSPIIFTAVRKPGSTPDGQEIVKMKKIVDILGVGSPIVSDISGFGSIGIFPTMFAWYKVYGVDKNDPNHIIAPDIVDEKVKVTFNGGSIWSIDTILTKLVTQSGIFKFRRGPFTQITNISFDPDVAGHILVGTMQAGIFSTCDNGGSWSKISGTEIVPEVSGFYFLGNNKVVVSSYGRGLWKLSLSACPHITIPPIYLQLAEPLIYYMGALIPISQIHNPDVCPRCGFYLVDQGDIRSIVMSKEKNEVQQIAISAGEVKGFNLYGKQIEALPFQLTRSNNSFEAKDEKLMAMMKQGYKLKGVYLEGNIFKGLILAKEDIKAEQLPQQLEAKTALNVEVAMGEQAGTGVRSIRIIGKGFDKATPISITLDGKQIEMRENKAIFDNKGMLTLNLMYPFTPGGHTIVIEQKTATGIIKEATTFVIPLNDVDRERK